MSKQLALLDGPSSASGIEPYAEIVGPYRYLLGRRWDASKGICLFVGVNPSTANEKKDDKTSTKLIGYGKRWGFGAIEIVNLFAWRSKDPSVLPQLGDPVGPLCDQRIVEAAARASRIVVAWGNNGALRGRPAQVLELLSGRELLCFRITKQGQPEHPLYQKNNAVLVQLG